MCAGVFEGVVFYGEGGLLEESRGRKGGREGGVWLVGLVVIGGMSECTYRVLKETGKTWGSQRLRKNQSTDMSRTQKQILSPHFARDIEICLFLFFLIFFLY